MEIVSNLRVIIWISGFDAEISDSNLKSFGTNYGIKNL